MTLDIPLIATRRIPAGALAKLYLDFVNGQYWSAGSLRALSALPGYAYARTGAEAVVDSDNSIDSFPASAIPINGYGYHAYDALTNHVRQSQTFDNASWGKSNCTVTADAAVAPDGTTTADTLTASAGTFAVMLAQAAAGTPGAGTYTQSIFAKQGTYRYLWLGDRGDSVSHSATFDLQSGVIVGTTNATAYIIALGGGWYRCVRVETTGATPSVNAALGAAAHSADRPSVVCAGTETLQLWQGQILVGTMPVGGPLIATTSATASIGAPAFSVSCPNGSYTATYTFDDNSTQQIATTVSGGIFTFPTYPTLNRPRVKKLVLA